MSEYDDIQAWLTEHNIEDVEAFVPDMAGAARGKLIPAAKFGSGELKLPEGIFAQTVSGNYVDDKDNVEDRDMLLWPDPSTLRPVPWATDPAASIFLDCYRRDDSPVETSPRWVLRNVLKLYEDKGPAIFAKTRTGLSAWLAGHYRSGKSCVHTTCCR